MFWNILMYQETIYKKKFNQIFKKQANFIYRIFTKGVDSSASSRKLAKYGITLSVKT